MTAPTLESVTGLVEQINAKQTGIKVAGQWLNISQYHAITDMPKPGQHVEVQVQRTDRSLWINRIEILDGGQIHQLPQQQRRGGGGGGRSPAELRDIRRLSVLKAAAAFAAGRSDVKSADVLKIASVWLTWVEQPSLTSGEPPRDTHP